MAKEYDYTGKLILRKPLENIGSIEHFPVVCLIKKLKRYVARLKSVLTKIKGHSQSFLGENYELRK